MLVGKSGGANDASGDRRSLIGQGCDTAKQHGTVPTVSQATEPVGGLPKFQ
jgi:hypothetical protein